MGLFKLRRLSYDYFQGPHKRKTSSKLSKNPRLCLHVLLSCLGVAAFTKQQADKRACKYRAE